MKTLLMHSVCSFALVLLVISCGNKVNYDFIVRNLDDVKRKEGWNFNLKRRKVPDMYHINIQ